MDTQDKNLSPDEALAAEQLEASALIDQGMSFSIGKRQFIINQPFYGTLDHLASIYVKMDYSLEDLESGGEREAKILASKYSKLCADAVAVAVLRSKWKIRLFRRILASYFFWNLTPRVMHELARRINVMLNLGDFIHSIILMSASRTTKPDLMEAKQKA